MGFFSIIILLFYYTNNFHRNSPGFFFSEKSILGQCTKVLPTEPILKHTVNAICPVPYFLSTPLNPYTKVFG